MRTYLMTNDPLAGDIIQTLLKHSTLTGICTAANKRQGRGQRLQSPRIKTIAESHNIKVDQASYIKNNSTLLKTLQSHAIELLIVYSYGFILPPDFLKIAKTASINLHASLLPKYRGASPIQTALLNGDKETGISAQIMTEELDAGDIIHQIPIPINDTDNFTSLHKKCSKTSAQCTQELLTKYQKNTIIRRPQNAAAATYCSKIHKEDGKIAWADSYETINRKIKAYNHYPQSYTFYKDIKLIIHAIERHSFGTGPPPGTITEYSRTGIHIQSGDSIIKITKLQKASGKILNASDFINGHKLERGVILN